MFDNSHISGTHPVGAMIVATSEGFEKSSYRKYNIKGDIAPGDDYAMMREVFSRRYGKITEEQSNTKRSSSDRLIPDLVLIDGGKGQLSSAMSVLKELGLEEILNVVAISKGPDRNAGRETFHRPGQKSFDLPENSPVLYFLQRLRDEVHRFAVGSHQTRRRKASRTSALDGVPGIGTQRKKALLRHFGSAKAVRDAAIEDLEAVSGISRRLAEGIYGYFRDE